MDDFIVEAFLRQQRLRLEREKQMESEIMSRARF